MIMAAACLTVWVAQASPLPGRPWPHSIRVYDGTHGQWSEPIHDAVATLNSTPSGLSYRMVRSPHQADVIIKQVSRLQMGRICSLRRSRHRRCLGQASHIGYRGQQEQVFLVSRYSFSPRTHATRLVAHELLHIAGISHEDGQCSVMNRDAGEQLCPPDRGGWVRCGPGPSTLHSIQHSYGARRIAAPYSPYCLNQDALSVDPEPPLRLLVNGRWERG